MKKKAADWLYLWRLYVPVAGCFLPLPGLILTTVSAAVLVLLDKKGCIQALQRPGSRLLIGFIGLSAGLALFYHNYLGLLVSALAFLAVSWFLWLRTQMNMQVFEIQCALAAGGSLFSLLGTRVDFHTALSESVIQFFSQILNRPYEFSLAAGARSCSTFFHPNYYGYVMAVVLLICLAQLFACGKRLIKKSDRRQMLKLAFYLIVFAANLLGLDNPQSRTVYLALAAGMGMLMFSWSWLFLPVMAVPAGLIAVLKADKLLSLIPRIGSFLEGLNDRQEIWTAAWGQIQRQPWLGHGFYTYIQTWQNYSKKYTVHAHNLSLELLLSFGLLGTTVLIAAFVRMLYAPVRRWINGTQGQMPLVLGVIAMTLVHGFTDVVLLSPQTFLLFAMVLAFAELEPAEAPAEAKVNH